ncbi:MAG: hypothetical protein HY927_08900 [Elusimicrobia bacterium]|nr:hypothetical protein [Elusimicrobiota bacterium]
MRRLFPSETTGPPADMGGMGAIREEATPAGRTVRAAAGMGGAAMKDMAPAAAAGTVRAAEEDMGPAGAGTLGAAAGTVRAMAGGMVSAAEAGTMPAGGMPLTVAAATRQVMRMAGAKALVMPPARSTGMRAAGMEQRARTGLFMDQTQ